MMGVWSLYILMRTEGVQYAGIFCIYLFAELIGQISLQVRPRKAPEGGFGSKPRVGRASCGLPWVWDSN